MPKAPTSSARFGMLAEPPISVSLICCQFISWHEKTTTTGSWIFFWFANIKQLGQINVQDCLLCLDKMGKLDVVAMHLAGHQPDGAQPLSPSSKAIEKPFMARTPEGFADFPSPRALATHEIPRIVEQFRLAAKNAITAGNYQTCSKNSIYDHLTLLSNIRVTMTFVASRRWRDCKPGSVCHTDMSCGELIKLRTLYKTEFLIHQTVDVNEIIETVIVMIQISIWSSARVKSYRPVHPFCVKK